MNDFDDFCIEESSGFDFVEACYDDLLEEEETDSKNFNSLLNSDYDY
jgi:hypothetical protein